MKLNCRKQFQIIVIPLRTAEFKKCVLVLCDTEPWKGHRTVFLAFFILLPQVSKSFPQVSKVVTTKKKVVPTSYQSRSHKLKICYHKIESRSHKLKSRSHKLAK